MATAFPIVHGQSWACIEALGIVRRVFLSGLKLLNERRLDSHRKTEDMAKAEGGSLKEDVAVLAVRA